MRHRASLVRLRTSIKSRVHALLAIEGVQPPKVSDLFGKKGMKFLKEVELRQSRRTALDNYLEVLRVLGERINEIWSILREKAEITKEASWLMSIVGIGYHNALLILSEIGEIGRFGNPNTPNRFQRIYQRLTARRGEKVAIVATARHMAEAVYIES